MIEQEKIIEKTKNFIRKKFEGESSGHDWWHIYRVWQNSRVIGKEEGANMYVVQLGALLHDIADYKFHGGDFTAGPKAAREYLEKLRVNEKTINNVCYIVENISFKGAGAEKPMKTLEGKIVRDADRLDAMGAIGIARCFAYGGHKGKPIHLPEVKPKLHQTAKEYLARQNSQINHFHEKLLLLKDLMLTQAGKRMAKRRHQYMLQYLEQFNNEWEGLV